MGMMKRQISVLLCIVFLLSALLTGCGDGASPQLPDLSGMGEVQVIAREDGSGTRAELLETEVIASDAIAVVVNPANPLTDITAKQLSAIYDGATAKWSDVK